MIWRCWLWEFASWLVIVCCRKKLMQVVMWVSTQCRGNEPNCEWRACPALPWLASTWISGRSAEFYSSCDELPVTIRVRSRNPVLILPPVRTGASLGEYFVALSKGFRNDCLKLQRIFKLLAFVSKIGENCHCVRFQPTFWAAHFGFVERVKKLSQPARPRKLE